MNKINITQMVGDTRRDRVALRLMRGWLRENVGESMDYGDRYGNGWKMYAAIVDGSVQWFAEIEHDASAVMFKIKFSS